MTIILGWITLLLLLAQALGANAENVYSKGYYLDKFLDWMGDHGVDLGEGRAGQMNLEHALQNFATNDDIIEHYNAQNLSFKLAHNKFSHFNSTEWRAFVTLGYAAAGPLNTPSIQPGHIHNAPSPDELAKLPREVDWRTQQAVTAVKDQGQCGSCWSFATTGALEGANKIKSGTLVALSEQNLVDCNTWNSGCDGGSIASAFIWSAWNGGLCAEDEYPYLAVASECQVQQCQERYAAPQSFTNVEANSEDALMSAVAQQPVAIAIEADESTFQLYSSGVLTAFCGANLNHAVLLIGYGAAETPNSNDVVEYWLLKNSWGPDWGEDGYIRIARSSNQTEGNCGILSGPPSYPNL